MERVETLIQKLQQQFKNGAGAEELLMTVQMLQHELSHLQLNQPPGAAGGICDRFHAITNNCISFAG
jgi:hypothetical protein